MEVKEEGQGRRHLTTVGEAADILDLGQGHTHLVDININTEETRIIMIKDAPDYIMYRHDFH